jgi:hypothetical protein
VDGTDFWIEEPIPFDRKWFSHKINGPAVRYEVGVCIKTGWIVWINGPFPAGRWPDINIARLGLIHCLDAGEYYAADGGYSDGHQFASTPNGLNDYRHSLVFHGTIFHAVAGIVQLTIQYGHPLFDIEYNETDFFVPNAV